MNKHEIRFIASLILELSKSSATRESFEHALETAADSIENGIKKDVAKSDQENATSRRKK